nr:zinc finger MYM-type protein 1-like [Hydra vulgaris]
MAGIYNGVQALIRQNNPQAIFIPCSAHSLNLCAVYAIESSAPAKSYFGNIQKLYNLFSSSPVRWKILQEETGQSLHKLSVTQWSSRIESVKPLAKKPREILKLLHRLKELDLPGEINNVSLLLQSTQLTLDDEVKILNVTLMDLDRIRLSWDLILIEATEVAKNFKFDKIMFSVKRTRKKIISDETAGYNHEEASKNFECNVFNVALDNLTSQMRSRFKVIEEECSKFSFLWSLQKSQTDQELGLKAENLAKLYPEDLCKNKFSDEVRHFFSVRRNILASEKPVELLNEVYAKGLHSIFPQVCVSLRIFLTFPVSTSEGERSSSKLAIIKNYLRSTMGQERLCYLMILSIESDLAINVNSNFAAKKARKISMQWTQQHNYTLLMEVLTFEPWQFKRGSKERGDSWEKILNSLNGLPLPPDPYFKFESDGGWQSKYVIVVEPYRQNRALCIKALTKYLLETGP